MVIEAAQPSVAASAVSGANTASGSSSGASIAATGRIAAAILARRRMRIGVGAQLSKSGASSAEMVIQARLPATWLASMLSAAALPGRKTICPCRAWRSRMKPSGIM